MNKVPYTLISLIGEYIRSNVGFINKFMIFESNCPLCEDQPDDVLCSPYIKASPGSWVAADHCAFLVVVTVFGGVRCTLLQGQWKQITQSIF